MERDVFLLIVIGVFAGNMATFVVVYSLWVICRQEWQGLRAPALAYFGFSLPLILVAALIATLV